MEPANHSEIAVAVMSELGDVDAIVEAAVRSEPPVDTVELVLAPSELICEIKP
jgi:hypothetical protein